MEATIKSEVTQKLRHGAEAGTDEWAYLEHGSWEDHNESPDHIYNIIYRFSLGKDQFLTIEQLTRLKNSLTFWLSFPDGLPTDRSCWKGYLRRINKLLKIQNK